MRIGVLALQGAFAEHIAVLQSMKLSAAEVRLPDQLDALDGLIIPGGESTTIGKLAEHYQLIEPLQEFGRQKTIWGTCAGAIFLSSDARRSQPLLHLMDIEIERNAFGRQAASFQADIDVPALDEVSEKSTPYPAIFIRAPLIDQVGPGVEVLSRLKDGRIVAARQDNLLATVFHPELTGDNRFHRLFLNMVGRKIGES
jgi:pyridoxal 5'-phosphate synthase pdxT subunit